MKSKVFIKNIAKLLSFSLFFGSILTSCSNGLNDINELEGTQARTGFVIVGTTASNNALVKYF